MFYLVAMIPVTDRSINIKEPFYPNSSHVKPPDIALKTSPKHTQSSCRYAAAFFFPVLIVNLYVKYRTQRWLVQSAAVSPKIRHQTTPALASSPGCHFKDWLVFFKDTSGPVSHLYFLSWSLWSMPVWPRCHCQYDKTHFSSTFTNTFGQPFHTTTAGIHVIHLPKMTKTGEQTVWPEALRCWQMCSGTTSMHHEP